MIGSCLMMSLEGPRLLKRERKFIVKNQIAGLILFQRNIESWDQLSQLNREIKSLTQPAPLIAIDMEGGRVNRFSHLKDSGLWPSAEELSRFGLPELFLKAQKQARQLKSLGLDLNFAPVVDLPLASSELLRTRTFGNKPSVILKAVRSYLKAYKEQGILSCLKHFPGHGGVLEDSHETLPADNRSLKALQPQLGLFQSLVKSFSLCIMTAHVEFPKIEKGPATFSKKLLKQILRKKMSFEGAVISDDMDMKALKSYSPEEAFFLALKAGCDILLFCQDLDKPYNIVDYFESQMKRKQEIKTDLSRASQKILHLKKLQKPSAV